MNNIFENISFKEVSKIMEILNAHQVKFPKNKNISVSVKDVDSICVVLKGLVNIIKNDEKGNFAVVEEITDNQVFGSTISNIANPEYDVITKEETTVIILDISKILSLDNKSNYYSQFIKNILNIYQDKIKKNNERIEVLTNKTIRDKLLSYFNILSSGGTIKTIYLPFTYSDLANYLGVNRSAMTRELNNLKDEGIIETNGRKIKLHYYVG